MLLDFRTFLSLFWAGEKMIDELNIEVPVTTRNFISHWSPAIEKLQEENEEFEKYLSGDDDSLDYRAAIDLLETKLSVIESAFSEIETLEAPNQQEVELIFRAIYGFKELFQNINSANYGSYTFEEWI